MYNNNIINKNIVEQTSAYKTLNKLSNKYAYRSALYPQQVSMRSPSKPVHLDQRVLNPWGGYIIEKNKTK